MAKILSSDVLINKVTGERTTEIVVADYYQKLCRWCLYRAENGSEVR